MSQIDQLKKYTVIVADTGDIEEIRKYRPTDATTNPSLLLASASKDAFAHLTKEAIEYGMRKPEVERLEWVMNRLSVNFGTEITKIVEGVVSTEVDARHSFDTHSTIKWARRIIKMYEEKGVPSDRILIKIASTWQGIKAGEILEKEGIHCNMTLLFNLESQARAAAEAGVTLISPFVGRITDWYKEKEQKKDYPAEEDPGVKSVRAIYQYYKEHGYPTIVMGASFRNKNQITALAGCDKLTIAPGLLKELQDSKDQTPQKLKPIGKDQVKKHRPQPLTEDQFYWHLSQDPMATEKLAEGIRKFAADSVKLEKQLLQKMGGSAKPASKL